MKHRRLVLSISVAIATVIVGLLFGKIRAISGVVRTSKGQVVSGALVRVKTKAISTETGSAGRFFLTGFVPSMRVHLTAWKDGYYVAGADVWPWDETVEFMLEPYTVPDNREYSWILPAVKTRSTPQDWLMQAGLGMAAGMSFQRLFLPLSERLALGCSDCHSSAIYDQWRGSAHALGTKNGRFLTMYNGTNVAGNRSPRTRRGYNRDYGSFPLRPDPTRPYYGPGYKLDFPETAGNCAACHLPSAAIENPYGVDPNQASGVEAEGIHCDFCHKIAEVKLDPSTGRPFANTPGVLSIELMRPDPKRQLFFGPYDDVDVGPDTYLPLMKQSDICVPCHDGSFWGVPIYQSFAEWQASPYAVEGKTCQLCHMKPDGVTTNFAPGRGGLERNPETIPTHFFPGAVDKTLLQNAVTMTARAQRRGEQTVVTVSITNDKTGHHIPTDSPLRQMILLLRASDEQGRNLPLLKGPTVPEYGGVGDPARGYYAGLPGKGFAKVLEELWTGVSPTGAYWNPTRIVKDNRIAAFATDTSAYVFETPSDGEVNIEVNLLFRRAFMKLMKQKGWNLPDIVMEKQVINICCSRDESFANELDPTRKTGK